MQNYNQLSDQLLIEAFCQGQPQASETIYRRYFPMILNFCSQYLHSWEDGKDAAQDVFIKVLVEKKLLQFRQQAKLSSWLIRIAINICNIYFQRKKALQEVGLTNINSQELNQNIKNSLMANPEDQMIQTEIKEKLKTSIKRLPLKYCQVLRSTYLEERSYIEASQHLNISLHVLGVQLLRGKKMLSKLIKRDAIKSKGFLLASHYWRT